MADSLPSPHWGSKGAINRAGDALRAGTETTEQLLALEAWRMAHRSVIHAFEGTLRARARGKEIIVAQRLKRGRTIRDKLRRHPRMDLARMDDIAGCRLIFPSIAALNEYRSGFHGARFSHIRKNDVSKYDYIATPTERGYRGIHDIYEYRAKAKRSTRCNGLLIEVQYRTQLQHAWATAVEVITQLTENEPKFNRGDQRYIRLFCLASEILARAHEGRKSCLPEMTDIEVVDAFNKIDVEINVIVRLVNLQMHHYLDEHAKSKHVILQLSADGGFMLHAFDTELEASGALRELEALHPKDDVVLVGADTISEIASAFRNYFADVRDFMKLLNQGRGALHPNWETVENPYANVVSKTAASV